MLPSILDRCFDFVHSRLIPKTRAVHETLAQQACATTTATTTTATTSLRMIQTTKIPLSDKVQLTAVRRFKRVYVHVVCPLTNEICTCRRNRERTLHTVGASKAKAEAGTEAAVAAAAAAAATVAAAVETFTQDHAQ